MPLAVKALGWSIKSIIMVLIASGGYRTCALQKLLINGMKIPVRPIVFQQVFNKKTGGVENEA